MRIGKDTVVTLHCKLHTLSGQCVDDGREPLIYLHGKYEGLFPSLEIMLEGKSVGDHVDLMLDPEDAYGDLETRLIFQLPIESFPEDVTVGMSLVGGPLPQFDEEEIVYKVIGIDAGKVIVDGNHPLAGKTLQVSCMILDVRPATTSEIEMRRPRV